MSSFQRELKEAADYRRRADAIRAIEPVLAQMLDAAARACTAKANALITIETVVAYLEQQLSTPR